jgi:metallo-beta-lactamase family protein
VAKNGIPTLQFLGAAQTVTGSKYLLSFAGKRLLVDCGLFQGLKNLRLQNWDSFPVDPKTIDAVILTHAHIDHSGYIPRLIKEGFAGKVYCTEATKALCQILLPDTGYLQEEEAEYLNRRRISKHNPALPLFSQHEAEVSLQRFETRGFDEELEPVPGFRCTFRYAGHILGAASVVVRVGNRSIGFSGDVGRPNDAVLFQPARMPAVDYLVIESTYGDRKHPDNDPMDELGQIVRQTARRNGVVLIPAFTVGRAQTLLYFLAKLKRAGSIPNIPMYLNSPMATHVTDAFIKFRPLHKLTGLECEELRGAVKYIESVEESKALNESKGPMVIISASGMATGGRILHHLKAFAPDRNNSIVLTGFQAAGTRGEALLSGVKEVKIHGQMVPVQAQIFSLENLSAHADCHELISWLQKSKIKPKNTFVTHGEPLASESFRQQLQSQLDWLAEVPKALAVYQLE